MSESIIKKSIKRNARNPEYQDMYPLFEAYNNGDNNVLNFLFEKNKRLIGFCINLKNLRHHPLYDDLVSEGGIGLFKAIKTFKYKQYKAFSPYAMQCIINQMFMFLRTEKRHDLPPKQKLPLHKEGSNMALSDILPDFEDHFAALEDEEFFVNSSTYIVSIAKSLLSERNFKMISLFYGLENQIPHSQIEIARIFNLSRSYTNRALKQALQKLYEAPAIQEMRENL